MVRTDQLPLLLRPETLARFMKGKEGTLTFLRSEHLSVPQVSGCTDPKVSKLFWNKRSNTATGVWIIAFRHGVVSRGQHKLN